MHNILLALFICPLFLLATEIQYLDIALTGPISTNPTVVPNTASLPSLKAEVAELHPKTPHTFQFITHPTTPLIGSARFITPISPLEEKTFTLKTEDFSNQPHHCTLTFKTNFQRYLDVTVNGICFDQHPPTFFHEARRSKPGQIQLITTPNFNLLFAFQAASHHKT